MIKLNVRKSNVYVVFFPRIAQEHIFSRSSPSSVSSAGLRESCSKINLLSSLARVSRRKRARACQTASATCCKARTRWCSRGRCAGVRRRGGGGGRARSQRRPASNSLLLHGLPAREAPQLPARRPARRGGGRRAFLLRHERPPADRARAAQLGRDLRPPGAERLVFSRWASPGPSAYAPPEPTCMHAIYCKWGPMFSSTG